MKKILITGASGFIGSWLVEEALDRQLKVYAGVRRTSSRQYLQDKRISFLEMDFSDEQSLLEQFSQNRFDYIIHNAGVTKANKKADFFKYNYELTRRFGQVLQKTHPNLQKFVYISSLASYGPADNHPEPVVKEHFQPHPIDTYGKSKLASERWIQQQSNFPYLIFRPAAVYGPREKDMFTFFKAFSRGLEGHIGRTPQQMAFIYVKDLIRLVLDATLSSVDQKSYFVSDGNAYPTQELGRIAEQVLQKKPLISVNIPLGIVKVAAGIGELTGRLTGKMPPLNLEKLKILQSQNWQCDVEPLRQDFNFQAKYNLEKGLTETLRWYVVQGWLS